MDPALFKEFCDLAYAQAGIVFREGKEALLDTRIAKRLRALSLETPEEYLEYIKADKSGQELVSFLDVITTNFTHFFREKGHLDYLGEQMTKWLEAGQRRFRFWSAASSTGQEPYSMAIMLLEAAQGSPMDVKILATDISTAVLAKAREGVYDEKTLEPIGLGLRSKYFTKVGTNGEGGLFQAKPALRELIVYKRLNLAHPPFPMQGPLDAVFCRNVMIYFNQPVRQGLVGAIEGLLKPGGFLAVGHAETLSGLKTKLKSVQPSVYEKLA